MAHWLRCCATNRKVAGSIPDGVIGIFHSHNPSDGPGVDSASNINEYQEYFLRSKVGRCVRLTILPPPCAVVMKSGKLNFLETFGPLQACNRTDLHLPYPAVYFEVESKLSLYTIWQLRCYSNRKDEILPPITTNQYHIKHFALKVHGNKFAGILIYFWRSHVTNN